MGYDISYHPISKEQIHQWYFDILEDIDLANKLKVRVPSKQLKNESQRNEFEEFYLNKYKETIETAKKMKGSFNRTHAYIAAIVQGFFEEFFYTRGAALSFIENDDFFNKYTTSWKEIAPTKYLENFESDGLFENYSGGVYLSHKQVEKLLVDYEKDKNLRDTIDELFSHDRINVFLNALKFAKEKGLGLLEATEVVEPHPDVKKEPTCYCNLFNCDPAGITLFQMAVMEQMKEAMELNEKKEKKGFWKKLFGK